MSAITVLSFGQMVILFVLQLVLARSFGTSSDMDAYLAAFVVPLVVGGILSSSVGTAVIPLYSELKASRDESTAESTLARLGLILLAGAGAFALTTAFLSDSVIGLLFSEFSASQSRLSADLLQTLSWLIPLNTLTGFLFGVEHARRRFVLPAISGILGPALTIVLYLTVSDRSIESLALSVLVGTLLSMGLLAVRYPRLRRSRDVQHSDLWRRFAYLCAPLVLGAAYTRLDVFVDRVLASQLTAGSISQLGYASRIVTAIVALGTSGLSVVAFPALAQHAATREWGLLQIDLKECWRFLAIVLIPVLGGIIVSGHTIVTAVFEHGEFTASDSAAVSRLLILLCGVILAAGIGEIANRTFYALGKPWVPTIVGMAGFTMGTIAKILVVGKLGVEGLAGMTSLYYVLNVVASLVWLSLMGLIIADHDLVTTILRSVAASILSIAPAVAVMSPDSPTRVLVAIAMAVAIYLISLALLGDEFARRAFRVLRGGH